MINLPKMTAHRRLHIQNQVCLTVKIVVLDQTFHKNDAVSDKEKNLCVHLCFKGGKSCLEVSSGSGRLTVFKMFCLAPAAAHFAAEPGPRWRGGGKDGQMIGLPPYLSTDFFFSTPVFRSIFTAQ